VTPPDLARAAVSRRLREAAAASQLARDRRLAAKIDMSPGGVAARLRKASALREFCLALARIGRRNGLGGDRA
jgi:hypothetical protein